MKKTTRSVRKTAKKAPKSAKRVSAVKKSTRKPAVKKSAKKPAVKTLYRDEDVLVRKVGRNKIEICAK